MWEEKSELYDQLISAHPNFERKGKSMAHTSANSHMFSQLNKAGEIGIRFSDERMKQLIDELCSSQFKAYGASMKGYVLIPDSLLANHDRIAALLEESYQYVMSLEPK